MVISQGDVDKDGFLDYGEFVAISVHLRKMANEEHLKAAFEFFDKNQNGYIEIDELREALDDEIETNSEEVINAIMQDVDTDKVSNEYFYFVCFMICFLVYFSDVVMHNYVLTFHPLAGWTDKLR